MNVLQNTIHFIPLHQTMAAEDISGDRAQRKIPQPLYYTAPFLSSHCPVLIYKEYDGCYLGHYAQWFFWFFFAIGISVVAGSMALLIARYYGP